MEQPETYMLPSRINDVEQLIIYMHNARLITPKDIALQLGEPETQVLRVLTEHFKHQKTEADES